MSNLRHADCMPVIHSAGANDGLKRRTSVQAFAAVRMWANAWRGHIRIQDLSRMTFNQSANSQPCIGVMRSTGIALSMPSLRGTLIFPIVFRHAGRIQLQDAQDAL